MSALKGSKTEENLKAAFAGESQANRRYLYFANKADVEGQNDVAALFRLTFSGGAKQRCHVVLTFNIGLVCEIEVTAIGL